jgi:Ca2+/Na+ antiporter
MRQPLQIAEAPTMLVTELLLAFALALLITLGLAALLGWFVQPRRIGWDSITLLFLIIFLGVWTLGVWTTPFGPVLWEVYWVPFIVAGVFLLLVFAAVFHRQRPPATLEAEAHPETKSDPEAVFTVFAWLLIVALIIALVAYYL